MNPIDRFNQIIELIESLSQNEHMDKVEISKKVSETLGYDVRDTSRIFEFLTGYSLTVYIKERKMMAAYMYLISPDYKKIMHAVDLSPYQDQSTFSTRLKEMIGLTPKEAQDKKDSSLFMAKKTWDTLFAQSSDFSKIKEGEPVEESIYVFTEGQIKELHKIMELQALYDFNSMYSEYAVNLAREMEYSLEDAFAFADSLREYEGAFDYDDEEKELAQDGLTPKERLENAGDDYLMQCLFFKNGLSVSSYKELKYFHVDSDEELEHCTEEIMHAYSLTYKMQFSYFLRAWNYYKEHADESYADVNLEEYLYAIDCNVPMQTAFEEIIPGDPDDWLYDTMDEFPPKLDPLDFEDMLYDDSDDVYYDSLDMYDPDDAPIDYE